MIRCRGIPQPARHSQRIRKRFASPYAFSTLADQTNYYLIYNIKNQHRGDEGFPENTMLLPRNPFRHTIRIPLSNEEYSDYLHEGALLLRLI